MRITDTVDYRADDGRGFATIRFFDSAGPTGELSGAELTGGARAVAAGLARHGVRHQDRVLLIAPTGPDYLFALLGCLRGGIAPATVSPPATPDDPASAGVRHLHAAIGVIRPAAVLATDPRLAPAVPDGTPLLLIDDLRADGSGDGGDAEQAPVPKPGDVHHVQLTSGSTSTPKAAVLTNAGVAAHLRAVHAAMELAPDRDRVFSWLPLYHDMGFMLMLIGLTAGVEVDLMPTASFVRDPVSWPRHMSAHRTTVTAAPPFSYRVAADRFAAKGGAELDLSMLRQAYVGAEPIAVDVLRRFQDTFGPHGLAEDTLLPCYGMAETVVATTLCLDKHATTETSFGRVRWRELDRAALDEQLVARPGRPGEPVRSIVSCGTPIQGLTLRVTHPDGSEAGDGEIGAIHVRGASVMAGYLTTEGFHEPPDGWHDTGDLGLRLDGELYVVGRSKEMLIVRGRNLPPYDLENVVEDHPLVGPGTCVVFSHHGDTTATEQVVAVIETRAKAAQLPDIRTDVAAAVRQAFGLSLADVVFVPRGGIPRTTSGKRRRQAVRDAYVAGRLAS